MARRAKLGIAAIVVSSAALCCGFAANGAKEPKRFGAVIGVKPEKKQVYYGP